MGNYVYSLNLSVPYSNIAVLLQSLFVVDFSTCQTVKDKEEAAYMHFVEFLDECDSMEGTVDIVLPWTSLIRAKGDQGVAVTKICPTGA